MPLRGIILPVDPPILTGLSVVDPENTATMGAWIKTSRPGAYTINIDGWVGKFEATEVDTWQYLTSPASPVLYAEAEL